MFAFFELRAAAPDLRDAQGFDARQARRRIALQLETLSEHGIRHAVLGAFGCGAFGNPAEAVAAIGWFAIISGIAAATRAPIDPILAHAATNLAIGIYVVATGAWWLM